MDADHLLPPLLKLAAARNDAVRITAGGRRVADLRPASVVALGLRDGTPLTPHLHAAINARAAFEQAYKAARTAIARRPLSAQTVRDRLSRRGFDSSAIDAAVETLLAEGLIDDTDLARRLLREENARGGAGPALLTSKLAARGVDPDAAMRAIEEDDAPPPATRALHAAERRAASLPADLPPEAKARRLYAFLARRGFEEHDAAEAVRRVLGISADDAL